MGNLRARLQALEESVPEENEASNFDPEAFLMKLMEDFQNKPLPTPEEELAALIEAQQRDAKQPLPKDPGRRALYEMFRKEREDYIAELQKTISKDGP